MSIDDLLKPRYKVIAPYPHMELDQHGVGDIISPYGMGFVYPEKVKEQYDSYPHLFQPLQWHEERKPEDMPEYFKFSDDLGGALLAGERKRVYKIGLDADWHFDFYKKNAIGVLHKSGGGTLIDYVIPVSEEEYTTYINQTKQ